MSDVFKNIADAAGSSSVRRGFADLFSASKAALDEIQAGLGGILPSMPGMPVASIGEQLRNVLQALIPCSNVSTYLIILIFLSV